MGYGIIKNGVGVYIPETFVDNYKYVEEGNLVKRPEDRTLPEKITLGLGIKERRKVPASDNSTTLAVKASKNAIERAGINPEDIACVYFATESPVNAVAPPTELIETLGLKNETKMHLNIFTCAGGMLAIETACNEMHSPKYRGKYILVVSSDTAQAYIGDELENTVGDGACAFLIGENPVAELVDSFVYTSSTKDFWRENGDKAPSHKGKETVKAYKNHVIGSIKGLLNKGYEINQFSKIGVHSPFPKIIEWLRRDDKEPKIENNPLEELLEEDFRRKTKIARETGARTGNPYSATIGIIFSNMLEQSVREEDLLLCSYGSGATAISMYWRTHDGIELLKNGKTVEKQLESKKEISPSTAKQWLEERIKKH
ncbi:MAG: hypothetical protein PHW96_01575 [Candidatus Nanoarchaeia archaeon]|nr:hypothetical protein [Candidatus Nanoarchaeia archaeon]